MKVGATNPITHPTGDDKEPIAVAIALYTFLSTN